MSYGPITEPGVYPAGLPRSEWPPGLSPSGAKTILKTPAEYKWSRSHPKDPTPDTELGTIVHALALDTEQCWRTIDGGRGVTERRNATRAEGLIPTTLDALAEAARMAHAIKAHTEARELLDHCTLREVPVFGVDPDTGVMVRGQLDALGERVAIDVKTVREGGIAEFARQAVNFGYDIQASAYDDLLTWAGHRVEVVAFVLVEKVPPYSVAVRLLDDDFMALGRRKWRRALSVYARCVEADEWPGHEPYAYVSAPRWALAREEAI